MRDMAEIDSEIEKIVNEIHSKRFDNQYDAYQFRFDVFDKLTPLYREKYKRHYEERGYKNIEVRGYNNMIIQRHRIESKHSYIPATIDWGIAPFYTVDEFKQIYYTFLTPAGIMESWTSWLVLLHILDDNSEPISPLSCNGTFCDQPDGKE